MTVVRTHRLEDPVPLLDHRPPLAWLSPGRRLVGFGEALRLDPGPPRFRNAESGFARWCRDVEVTDDVRLPGTGPIAFVSLTFDPAAPGSTLVVPEVVIGEVEGTWFVTTVGEVDPTPLFHPAGTGESRNDRPRYAGSSIPDVMWMEAVAQAIELIARGDLEKVVLARDLAVWSKTAFDHRRLLGRLHRRFPTCHTFLVDGLVGASPELLVRRRGREVDSLVLAGTAPRSDDRHEDETMAKALLASEKDAREHELAAASVGRVLGELCERVVRDAQPRMIELANVRHLATRFRGRLRESPSTLEVADRLHPTAAVGGTPTDQALEVIRRLEGMDRGRYAGPVGWMDREGDGELAIALRCAQIAGTRARLFAGNGIVAGSLPEDELEETRLKLMAMQSVLE